MKKYCAVGLVVASWVLFPSAAQAAQDRGQAYPCTPEFAEAVVMASGFDQLAAQANPSFRSPDFWVVGQVFCADFDLDGSDEMAILLGAMGGNDPWGFFEVPGGSAAQASYAYVVISGGSYPNHSLELIVPYGQALISDTQRLYRKHDPHCCPTGGSLIQTIGFKDGQYQLLDQRFVRSKRQQSECGDPRGPASGVRVRGVRCGAARRLARSYARRTVRRGGPPRRAARYRCRSGRFSYGSMTIRCRRGKHRVVFELNFTYRYCGDDDKPIGAGWAKVESVLVSCPAARNLAHSVFWYGESGSFSCKQRRLGIELSRWSCRRGLRRVTFEGGA